MSDSADSEGQYEIQISMAQQRTTAGVRAQVPVSVEETVNFNQILYNALQKPVDEQAPIHVPPGRYFLRVEAYVVERDEAESVQECAVEAEEEHWNPPTPELDQNPPLESPPEEEPDLSALVARASDKGKGKKTAPARRSGGVPPKPKRRRR